MKACGYITDFKTNAEGDVIGDVECGAPVTHVCEDGMECCADCADVMRREGFIVKARAPGEGGGSHGG